MATQLIAPNLDPVMYDDNGNVLFNWLGWCANYVRTSFGIPKKIARAWWVWQQSPSQHADRNFPVGVYFPLYFRYTAKLDNSGDNEWGHTAIAYVNPNGSITIWSSPILHKPYADTWSSIAQVEQKYGVSYVGWSEHVNGTQVIQLTQVTNQPQGDNIVIVGDGDNWYGRLNKSMNQSRGRDASRDELTPFVGIDSLHMFEAVEDNPEADAWYQLGLLGRQASTENWQGQLTQYKTSVDQLNAAVTNVTEDDTATKAQLQDALSKVATLTTQLKDAASTPVPTKTIVPDPSYFSVGELFKALYQKIFK